MSLNYQQTIDYLFSQLPMYQRQGKSAVKKDLGNITLLSDYIGKPHLSYPTIHLAGTNGKGTTAHILAAYLQTQGLKVGLYTSPHYIDFRERIKVNGSYISKGFVVKFVQRNKSLFHKIEPSFFEITVAMAFKHFQAQDVDISIIETGLGGRLDSTNILQPLLSVITNISLDHQSMLGHTVEKIAYEKAGIIKPHTPVVIGEKKIETARVFIEKASETDSKIVFAEDILSIEKQSDTTLINIYKDNTLWIKGLKFPLEANYQIQNLRTAIIALQVLEKIYPINAPNKSRLESSFDLLVGELNYVGRWQQLINIETRTWVDSAHNIVGINYILKQIKKYNFEKLHFVLGMVSDKNHEDILRLLPKDYQYYFCNPKIPRALDAEKLKEKADKLSLNGNVHSSVQEAIFAAIAKSDKAKDMIFIGGSTFVVAEALASYRVT